MGAPIPHHFLVHPNANALVAQWRALCEDPLIQALPHKVETNQRGQLLMSPARNRHSLLQAALAARLTRLAQLHGIRGAAATECAIVTSDGVKVPDVVWMSGEPVAASLITDVVDAAPPVCIEVLSPSNSEREMQEKAALYFAADTEEVWLCATNGAMRFLGQSRELTASAPFPDFPRTLEIG